MPSVIRKKLLENSYNYITCNFFAQIDNKIMPYFKSIRWMHCGSPPPAIEAMIKFMKFDQQQWVPSCKK